MYLLLLAISLQAPDTHRSSPQGVGRDIISNQRNAVKNYVHSSVRYDYKLTRRVTSRLGRRVFRLLDSAFKADGVIYPFSDSLHFISAYYVGGFVKLGVWRDSATYYEWGHATKFRLVRKRWRDVEGEWRQLINAAILWDNSFFKQHLPFPESYVGHGYSTLYTRWYARGQGGRSHTIPLFIYPD